MLTTCCFFICCQFIDGMIQNFFWFDFEFIYLFSFFNGSSNIQWECHFQGKFFNFIFYHFMILQIFCIFLFKHMHVCLHYMHEYFPIFTHILVLTFICTHMPLSQWVLWYIVKYFQNFLSNFGFMTPFFSILCDLYIYVHVFVQCIRVIYEWTHTNVYSYQMCTLRNRAVLNSNGSSSHFDTLVHFP